MVVRHHNQDPKLSERPVIGGERTPESGGLPTVSGRSESFEEAVAEPRVMRGPVPFTNPHRRKGADA